MNAPEPVPDPGLAAEGDPQRVHTALSGVPHAAQRFQGQRAGVVTRTIAGGIDYLLVTVAVLATYAGIGLVLFLIDPRTARFPQWHLYEFVLLGAVYFVAYLTPTWYLTGRSVGARVMGVRVVNFNGDRLFFVGALLRALFYVVFPIGLFWCAVNRHNRSIQDVVLRTSVIHDWSHPRVR